MDRRADSGGRRRDPSSAERGASSTTSATPRSARATRSRPAGAPPRLRPRDGDTWKSYHSAAKLEPADRGDLVATLHQLVGRGARARARRPDRLGCRAGGRGARGGRALPSRSPGPWGPRARSPYAYHAIQDGRDRSDPAERGPRSTASRPTRPSSGPSPRRGGRPRGRAAELAEDRASRRNVGSGHVHAGAMKKVLLLGFPIALTLGLLAACGPRPGEEKVGRGLLVAPSRLAVGALGYDRATTQCSASSRPRARSSPPHHGYARGRPRTRRSSPAIRGAARRSRGTAFRLSSPTRSRACLAAPRPQLRDRRVHGPSGDRARLRLRGVRPYRRARRPRAGSASTPSRRSA